MPIATRTLAALADDDAIDATLGALDVARAQVRGRAWELGAVPPPVAAAAVGVRDGPLCLDLDATLVIAHSDDKDGAAKTYKRSWGFHPMTAWLDRGDGTGEALAIELRKGNAGANTAADQITMVDRAIAQLPELPDELDVLIRADTAGAVHALTDHIRDVARCRFSVGMPLKPAVRTVIHDLPFDDARWGTAITQHGTPRKGAAVAEITDLVDLSAGPKGSRLIVRHEPLHPGAQQTFDDIDGHRFTAFLTDQTDDDIAVLDARHRAHARVEDRIRCAKNTGLAAMPLDTFDRNQLWCQLVLAACDLLVFTQKLALRGRHAIAEPRALRYQLLHVAGRICGPDGRPSCTSKPTGLDSRAARRLPTTQIPTRPRNLTHPPRSLTSSAPTSRRHRRRTSQCPKPASTTTIDQPATATVPTTTPNAGPTPQPRTDEASGLVPPLQPDNTPGIALAVLAGGTRRPPPRPARRFFLWNGVALAGTGF